MLHFAYLVADGLISLLAVGVLTLIVMAVTRGLSEMIPPDYGRTVEYSQGALGFSMVLAALTYAIWLLATAALAPHVADVLASGQSALFGVDDTAPRVFLVSHAQTWLNWAATFIGGAPLCTWMFFYCYDLRQRWSGD